MSEVNFLTSLLLPGLVGGGSALLLVRFLAERLFEHRMSKDIERYKTQLSERTDVLKTQLAIFSHEQNVATSRVDTQRADAIHTIYACVRSIINPVSVITAGVPFVNGTPQQSFEYYFANAENAHAACGKLANTLADHAIYFDNETYKEIANYAHLAMEAAAIYLQPLRRHIAEGASAGDLVALAEAGRHALQKSMAESIAPSGKRITAIFRTQLGIEKSFRDGA